MRKFVTTNRMLELTDGNLEEISRSSIAAFVTAFDAQKAAKLNWDRCKMAAEYTGMVSASAKASLENAEPEAFKEANYINNKADARDKERSEEHTSGHQIISYAVFCLKKKKKIKLNLVY